MPCWHKGAERDPTIRRVQGPVSREAKVFREHKGGRKLAPWGEAGRKTSRRSQPGEDCLRNGYSSQGEKGKYIAGREITAEKSRDEKVCSVFRERT